MAVAWPSRVIQGSMYGMPCLKVGRKVWPEYAAEALEYVRG